MFLWFSTALCLCLLCNLNNVDDGKATNSGGWKDYKEMTVPFSQNIAGSALDKQGNGDRSDAELEHHAEVWTARPV